MVLLRPDFVTSDGLDVGCCCSMAQVFCCIAFPWNSGWPLSSCFFCKNACLSMHRKQYGSICACTFLFRTKMSPLFHWLSTLQFFFSRLDGVVVNHTLWDLVRT